MTTTPRVTVSRYGYFRDAQDRSVCRAEASPASSPPRESGCECGTSTSERPAGDPESLRQQVRLSWDGCVVLLEAKDQDQGERSDAVEVWFTFRKTSDVQIDDGRDDLDRHHSYFIFDGRRGEASNHAKIEVGVPGFGLTGFVLLSLFLGNRVDVSKLRRGWMPSDIVDLSKIAPDQAWIYQGSFGHEAMRLLESATEGRSIRAAFALVEAASRLARPHLMDVDASVDEVRGAVLRDEDLTGAISRLREILAPFALEIEGTELLRLAREMEAEAEADRKIRRTRW